MFGIFSRSVIALILLVFQTVFSAPAFSADFATDSQGILDSLMKEAAPAPAKPKFRGMKTRSLNMRGLKRVKTAEGEARIMDLPPTTANVNLKIEFDVNSYRIRKSSIPLLDELGKALKNPGLKDDIFIVGGHTDSDGEAAYNMQLSFNRANAVKDYLTRKYAISSDRLKVVGYGETSSIASNKTAAGKQRNRRVEILKLEK